MKLVVYIIALLAIIGAAALSMLNINDHQEQLDLTKKEHKNVLLKKSDVEAKEGELAKEDELNKAEKQLNADNIARKDLEINNEKQIKKQSASLDGDLEELLTKKEEINQAILEIERELVDINVPPSEIAGFVTDLENQKIDLNKRNVALNEEVAIFKGSVESNKSVIGDFKDAQIKRRKNLNANKVSSLITAVDNEWGFVVVKPHEGAQIRPESKLVVIRGNKHIGRLNINAIEGEGRVLANIDYRSLVPGMKIRPGDRVILNEPLTQ